MRPLYLYLLLLLIAVPVTAQVPSGAPKRIVATRIVGAPPRMDGYLNDSVWSRGSVVSDFLQKDPVEFAPPSERTEVVFLYNDEALYVGARMFSSDGGTHNMLTRRDNSGSAERIIVSLDTYHDRLTAYSFSVTAGGVRTDYYHASDNEFDREYSFDPVWEARVSSDGQGWYAEMRIPFSQLRFNDLPEQVWGINMDRYVPHKNEDIYWIPISRTRQGWASNFGELVGILGIVPATRLELLPYVAASTMLPSVRDPRDPFVSDRDFQPRGGLDVKMGLGPNLTLDATINPDFGQVEADPASINLSAYETFFEERRPFFIEGSQLLNASDDYFYSRRIGARPHAFPSGIFDYADIPSSTTMLGAAKVSGRLSSGFSIAGLTAVTEREHARTFNTTTERTEEIEVEPLTGFGVMSMRQELDSMGSRADIMTTYVHRDMKAGSPLASILSRDAVTSNLSGVYRFGGGSYQIVGDLGGSYVAGDMRAIERIQRSSAHYFQRPDADHVVFDSTRTALAGYRVGAALEKIEGKHWTWGISAYAESPGLELNDIGRITSADDIEFVGSFTYKETTPSDLLRDYSFNLYIYSPYNFDWESSGTVFTLNTNLTLPSFWSSHLGLTYGTVGITDDMTRGGPYMGVSWNADASFSIASPYGAPVRGDAGTNMGINGSDNWYWNVWGFLSANIGDRLSFSLSPSFNRSVARRQYIGMVPGGRSETFGTRYVFGSLDQTTLSSQFRLSYSITPDLSLDTYAEPFIVSGSYGAFGELLAARSEDLRMYGTDGTTITRDDTSKEYQISDNADRFAVGDPDFRFGSFRSNVVLRWEWRPGSTLYLVWQQDRGLFEQRGDRIRFGDLFSPLSASGSHAFALKLSYWFPAG